MATNFVNVLGKVIFLEIVRNRGNIIDIKLNETECCISCYHQIQAVLFRKKFQSIDKWTKKIELIK